LIYLSVDDLTQIVKSNKSPLLSRSHCSSGDVITDAITSHAAVSEMRSVEFISGKLRSHHNVMLMFS